MFVLILCNFVWRQSESVFLGDDFGYRLFVWKNKTYKGIRIILGACHEKNKTIYSYSDGDDVTV